MPPEASASEITTSDPDVDAPWANELNAHAALALREMLLEGENYRQSVANYYGLGITDTIALSHLSARGDLGQTELARLLGRTTSSVTSMVDRLESAGFAVRAPHPADRRRTIIKLTTRGLQATRASDDWLSVAVNRLSPEEIPPALEILESVADGLRRSREAIPSIRH